ncbi:MULTISPECIES: MocR-like transcriptional regulator GabR [Virgibacillus]|uniref:HTH-type transcriptional regulatory protein GabR n=2 Tax=Virgibacillus TaxID=84406 RepID=A0A024Q9P2_9BACI|nr:MULTISPECIES: PLP-dependent aminotransferase family protein [Virgibacillus]EQB37810.1 hypothetical protein M948_04405 [Virgibacillus sp. CM-4]MYL40543.1 aminotransferase class I/II-fold pyridoxal phosphate-dependent enzyme [Virgibacillus massiliensis]GGJ58074.1 HTH-type transcriptional regulatory protein GabR [Virgibacillus kapii]CDQ38666.1 HTH-type transcriptional regulatory protein GabR [Virgibacillus massiliensis]
MLLRLDKTKKEAFIYQQIYEEIKAIILAGKIHANEKLPSKRTLATQLNVSVNTITHAYEQLLAEGYIYTIEKKGYYVEAITAFIQDKQPVRTLPDDLREESVDKKGWLSLSHMASDITKFPFKSWIKCQQKAINQHKQELSEFPHPQGPFIVRKTIARMITLSRGVVCEPEQVVIGAGTQLLIRQLMESKTEKTRIAMENPGYSRFYTLLKNMEFPVQLVDLDNKGMNIERAEQSKANLLFVTPSHQFPTGKIMPISRRIELLNWSLQNNDRYILEDDYDSEFKYETDNIPSLQSLDRNQRVIYTGTFSKTILPGLRISYMVLPPKLLRDYQNHHQHLIQNSNALALYTLHYFIQTGEYDRHVKRMNHYYKVKRKKLVTYLRSYFKHTISIEDIPAGLHFVATFKTEKRYEEVETHAKKEKLEIYSMRRFMLQHQPKQPGKIKLIIGFANLQDEDIEEAVNRLGKCVGIHHGY